MPQVVDSNWAWFILFGVFVANFLAGGIVFSFGILYTDFVERLMTPAVETSAVGAIAFALWSFSAPLARAMTSKLGYRFVTVIGGAVGGLGLLIGYFAPSIHYFYVFFGILVGGGFSLTAVASFIALEEYFQTRSDIAFSIASCGVPTGIFILPLITRALLDTYSYFGASMVLSALMLNIIPCGLLFKPIDKNMVIDRDQGKYKQMINPVENEKEKSLESSSQPQATETANKSKDHREAESDREKEEKMKLSSPKSPRYKAIEMPEETKVVPLNSAILRFDDFSVEEDVDDEEEDSPVDDEIETVPENAEQSTRNMEPDKIGSDSNVTEPDGIEKGSKENGKALLYVIIGLDDASMLCDGRIILYLLASILFAVGFGIPLCFYPDVSRIYGYDDTKAEWMLSLLGLGACVGVVVSNFTRIQLLKRLSNASALIVSISSVAAGLFVGFVHYFTAYRILLLTSFLFGIFCIDFLFMRLHIVEEIVHEKYHTSAYYLGVWISGIGFIVGIPVAGWLKDHYSTYTWSFAFAGISMGICGLLLLPLVFLKKRGTH